MKSYKQLQEGVYDPNIFHAVFLAGGPGSGKSFVARTTTGGLGMKVVNSDDAFERLLKKEGLSMKMPPEELQQRNIVRDRAKQLTATRQDNYIAGRLGLIIDGTGREYDRIHRQASMLRELGYETYMIFVNTSLDVALERNKLRTRTVPETIVKKSWDSVQRNIGKFQNFFGSKNFIIVDNNENDPDATIFNNVTKRVRALVNRKVTNPTAKMWIQQQLSMKKR
jgi:predicted kinase